jgi:microcompartment protein CcmK/EutM
MQLARVIGNVVASEKVPGLTGIRLLVVQPVGEDGTKRGKPIVAADTTLAGPGDLVHITTSREAALAMPEPFVPVDAAIISIVDAVTVESPLAGPQNEEVFGTPVAKTNTPVVKAKNSGKGRTS